MSYNQLIKQASYHSLDPALNAASELAKGYLSLSIAPSTKKAYKSDLNIFIAWCKERDEQAMPATPETIANFVAEQASGLLSHYQEGFLTDGKERVASTLSRRIAAIRYAHKARGYDPSPTDAMIVKSVIKGVRRKQMSVVDKKAAATPDIVFLMLEQIDLATLKGKRDKAILLLGFAGAFRRSELVALTLNDLHYTEKGLLITIRHSKTDQESEGETIPILSGSIHCPIQSVKEWIKEASITGGHLFRRIHKSGAINAAGLSPQSIALIIKDYAGKANLNVEAFSGHSLRRGFITAAANSGAQLFKIMAVSRHKSVETVKGYVEDSERFDSHAGAGLL